jgi:hypothetical protein
VQEIVLGQLSFNSSVSFSVGSAAANLTSVIEDKDSEASKTLRKSFVATLAQGTGISKDEVRELW